MPSKEDQAEIPSLSPYWFHCPTQCGWEVKINAFSFEEASSLSTTAIAKHVAKDCKNAYPAQKTAYSPN